MTLVLLLLLQQIVQVCCEAQYHEDVCDRIGIVPVIVNYFHFTTGEWLHRYRLRWP